ncbi:MAG: glycoside hydrolase family protein [Pseudomonadota bacterium]
MTGRMRTSQTGIDLITRFEGFRERSEPLSGGGHVIGYGHTRHAKANQQITEGDALTLLKGHDLPPIEKALIARCLAPLSQNEFDALVAFAFNIGLDNFLDSDVFALVNSGAKLNAAEAMAAWRKARVDGRVIVVDALVRRRSAERALFLEVPGGPTPAATPLVRPILDLATAILHPREPLEQRPPVEDTEDVYEAVADEDVTRSSQPEPEGGETADEAEEDKDASTVTAPKAEKRDVSARITRILGEDPVATEPVQGPSEESVEEITRAVSAIADPVEGETPSKAAPTEEQPDNDSGPGPALSTLGAVQEEKDDPVAAAAISALASQLREGESEVSEVRYAIEPESDPVPQKPHQNGADTLSESDLGEIADASPNAKAALVDDLEPMAYPSAEAPEKVNTAAQSSWGSLLLYGFSAFGGALIGAWGIHHFLNTMASTVPLDSDWALYAGPFAMLVGGLIFIIMGYYLLRALFTDG